jgi:hypothetical protein
MLPDELFDLIADAFFRHTLTHCDSTEPFNA